MASLEEKQARVIEATQSGYRGRLLARGQARGMVWREGVLPDNAPEFSDRLSYDLLAYGYALLSDGLDILGEDGDAEIARTAFEAAADALESVAAKGEDNPDRDFHRFISASAYHLARYSARAFSMLKKSGKTTNLSLVETALSFMMLRDMDGLETLISTFKREGHGADETLTERLSDIADTDGDEETDDMIIGVFESALTDNFFSALATAMLAFERGDQSLIDTAREDLSVGLTCAADLNHVPQWWCHRLATFLIGDLWASSFHQQLPLDGGELGEA